MGEVQQPVSRIAQSIHFRIQSHYIPIILGYWWWRMKVMGQSFLTATPSPSRSSYIPVRPQVQEEVRQTLTIGTIKLWPVCPLQPVPFFMSLGWVICCHLAIWLKCTSRACPGRSTRQGPGQKSQWKPIHRMSKYLKVIHQANIVLNKICSILLLWHQCFDKNWKPR